MYQHISVSDLSQYENLIQRTDRVFEIFMPHTDYNIKLTGTLIDHLYIDMGMCKC